MKTKKYVYVFATVAAIAGAGYISGSLLIWKTSANPDYVCVKNVTHGVCDNITGCDAWDTNTHKRTCYGYNITQTAYYHTRTSCEPWYTVAKNWTTVHWDRPE